MTFSTPTPVKVPGHLSGADQFAAHMEQQPFLRQVFNTLTDHGFEVWVVGGALRNAAMNMAPHDIDILTNASLSDLIGLFEAHGAVNVGRSFEVCMVRGIEIAACRAGKDFPRKDLGHRDVTFNAMAWNPVSGEFLDLFGGLADLTDKLVRFTGDPEKRIKEDPLRMVRACRFASKIEGHLAAETAEAIRTHADLLTTRAAPDRIQREMIKAMADKAPSIFFRNLHETGLLKQIFPCLDRCSTLDGGPHHGETVLEHCLLTGDALTPAQPLLRLGGFLHDVGKFSAAVVQDGQLSFPGHETFTDDLERDLVRLRFAAADIQYLLSLVRVHMRPLTPETTPKAARRILAMLETHGISCEDFLRLRIADKRGNLAKPPYTLRDIRRRLAVLLNEINRECAVCMPDLKIAGHEVMAILDIDPGPQVGEILNDLLDKVIDDPGLNTSDTLKELVKGYGDTYK